MYANYLDVLYELIQKFPLIIMPCSQMMDFIQHYYNYNFTTIKCNLQVMLHVYVKKKKCFCIIFFSYLVVVMLHVYVKKNQRTNGPINAHLRTGICDLS